ncbi:DUF4384 domain-containing protein [Deinococcus pimensis]|uniref:DUF4384 domain-containing protein n=1 Tax=Deinococcus pimensis TaxID=309888 RepID=UPI0004818ACD|nr:DUF4384 domain-containing protein [Deinococcus pimensis]
MNKLLLLPLALLASAASAQKVSAQSIIVNPTEPDLQVKVWTDRDATGEKTPGYAVGDHIRIYTSVNQDAYVYLFNVNPDGSINQILPNRFANGANFVKANTVKQFPDAKDKFTFDIVGANGLNKVLALASKTELNLDQISSFKSGEPFATVTVRGEQKLAQALSIVVKEVRQDAWVTDTAAYRTVQGRAGFTPLPQARSGVRSTWKATFSSDRNLKQVNEFYTGQLAQQGFEVSTTTTTRGRVVSRYETQDGGAATLTVVQSKPGAYVVTVVREL